MNAGIYAISFGTDQYIGQSSSLGNRFGNHLRRLTQGKHNCAVLQDYYAEHGVHGITFQILEIVDAAHPYDKRLLERENHFHHVYPLAHGKRKSHGKLARDEVLDIRARREAGEGTKSIAEAYDISHALVSLIASRKRYGLI